MAEARSGLASADGDDYMKLGIGEAQLYANCDVPPGGNPPEAKSMTYRPVGMEALRRLAVGAVAQVTNPWTFQVNHITKDDLPLRFRRAAHMAAQGVLLHGLS